MAVLGDPRKAREGRPLQEGLEEAAGRLKALVEVVVQRWRLVEGAAPLLRWLAAWPHPQWQRCQAGPRLGCNWQSC